MCVPLPSQLVTTQVIDLPDNEAAFSLAHVRFFEKSHEVFLLVGTVKDMKLHPRSHAGPLAVACFCMFGCFCVCVCVCA